MAQPHPARRIPHRTRRLTLWAVALAASATAVATRTASSASVAPSAPAPVEQLARTGGDDAARLLWIVAEPQPIIFAGARGCLSAGAACGWKQMLDLDSTALRSAALGTSLTEAITPGSRSSVGRPGTELVRLAAQTADAATTLAGDLRTWLDSGCGSSIDGVPVAVHPPDCGERTSTAQDHLAKLADLLERWPAPT